MTKRKHCHKKKTRRGRQLVVFFLRRVKPPAAQLTPKRVKHPASKWEIVMNPQLLTTDTKGFVLGITEIRSSDGAVAPRSSGPFAITVTQDADKPVVTVTEGSPDQTTPDIFRPNGTGNTGTVTIDVTDTSNNLSALISFDVVAPAVVVPDKMVLSLTPEA